MVRSHRKGALEFGFIAVPKLVLASPHWLDLPSGARSLMMDLTQQYTGSNNGRLCPAFEVMQRYGWTSKSTLVRAKRALLLCPFVVCTRKGHAPRTAEWVGFSWWRLNYDSSVDILKDDFPYLNFLSLQAASIDPNVGRERAKRKKLSIVPNLDRYPLKAAPGPPDSRPMEVRK